MKNRLLIPVSLLLCLLLLGLLSLHGSVFVISFPLLAYIGGALWFAPKETELSIRREMSHESVFTGTPVTIRVNIHNGGETVEEITLTDVLPEGVAVIEGSNELITTMQPNTDQEQIYSIRASRGVYTSAHTIIKTGESFDLFWKEHHHTTESRLCVKPLVPAMKSIPVRPPKTRSFAGPIPAQQGGAGVHFYTIRNYQPGDSQRHINWRITARHTHELFTNTYQMERIADIGLILDARWSVYHDARTMLFEHAITAVAALASAFIHDGNRVGLLIYGGTIQNVFPGYGKMQRERILKALAKAEKGHNYAMKNLEHLPVRLFPARSQIVMVSPLAEDDIAVLTQLRAKGYAVMLVCPNVLHTDAQKIYGRKGDIHRRSVEYACRLTHVEQSLLLRKARRAGILVVNWYIDKSLDHTIQEAMLRQCMFQRFQGECV